MASLSRPPTSLRSCCSARCTGCTLVQDPIRPGSQQSCRADRRVVAAASGSGADGCTTATPTELVQQQPGSRTARPLLVGASAVAASQSAAAAHAAEAAGSAAAAATAGPIPPGTFTPGPYEPGWEIWVGFVAGVVPFIIATVGQWAAKGRPCRAGFTAGSAHCAQTAKTSHAPLCLGATLCATSHT